MSDLRIEAGRRGKVGGHSFERAFAAFLGVSLTEAAGGPRTKVDIPFAEGLGLSIKNPKGKNTQALLTPPSSFLRELNPPVDIRIFLDLFFGAPTTEAFTMVCDANHIPFSPLSHEERRRNRVCCPNIPNSIVFSALNWLDSNWASLFDLIFTTGYSSWRGRASHLGWAWEKDNVRSVKVYPMSSLRPIFQASKWAVAGSGSVLHLLHPTHGKIVHLQMKGSGNKGSWEYHSMMFHVWRNMLEGIPALSESELISLVNSGT